MPLPSIQKFRTICTLAAGAALSLPSIARAQQAIDSAYTAQIRKDLEDPRITTELVDYLPASSTVPTPLKVLGHIIGTQASWIARLTSTNTSMRSPRHRRT